jgi:predicted DCC family thiol-disulfide oxidoreductase YuxK
MSSEKKYPDNVILFDGLCNFCNSSINFTIRHDKKNRFHFAALQSEPAIAIRKQFNLPDEFLSSVVLIENGKAYIRSTAALRIARRLNGAWPLFYGLIIIPRFIRDWVYNIVARNRYKWWGKKESCMVPTPEVRKKFLS